MIGPSGVATAKMLIMIDRFRERFSSGEMIAMIAKAPCIKPAAPMPATARPRMKATAEGPAAQRTEPADDHNTRQQSVEKDEEVRCVLEASRN